MDLGIQGKHALITGGGRGLGRSIAESLAREGCHVSLISRTAAELNQSAEALRSHGVKVYTQVYDLSQDDPEALRLAAEAAIGPVDILIVNAARGSRPKKLTHMADEDWYATIDNDLHGHYRLLKNLLPGLQARQWGRVVFIGSLSGMLGASAYPAYCTVKAAYEGWVKNLAVDYSKYGVTTNLISPGFIETERFRAAAPEAFLEKFKQATASKRLAQPEEIAAAVTFLCSQHAAYITGANLPVCGGLNLGNLW